MSRKTDLSDSSLELLLDTICNTFGGVLFISILVVILLNVTSQQASTTPPELKDQVELSEQLQDLAETEAKLTDLQELRAAHRQSVEQLIDPDAINVARELRRKQQQLDELARSRNSALGEIGKTQEEINDAAQQIKDVADRIAAAQNKLAAIKKLLEQERKSRSQTAALPKQRATTKKPLTILLKQGRLCSMERRGANGQPIENKSEFSVLKDSKGSYVEPIVSAGLSVNVSASVHRGIERKLAEFDSKQFFLQVVVWSDSFEHFAVVKQLLIAKGFEYRLLPIADSDKVYLGASAGQSMVQ